MDALLNAGKYLLATIAVLGLITLSIRIALSGFKKALEQNTQSQGAIYEGLASAVDVLKMQIKATNEAQALTSEKLDRYIEQFKESDAQTRTYFHQFMAIFKLSESRCSMHKDVIAGYDKRIGQIETDVAQIKQQLTEQSA